MIRLTCFLFAGGLVALQESEHPRSIVDELGALVEKTNALSSFHASYRVEMKRSADDSQSGSLEFAYEAPDRGRLKYAGPDGGMDLWLFGSRMTMRTFGEDGQAWQQGALPLSEFESLEPSDAERVLDKHFPPSAAAAKRLEAGCSFVLQWPGMDPESPSWTANVTYTNHRTTLLDWLRYLQEHASAIRPDGQQLVWSEGDSLCWISRASGFVERVEVPETTETASLMITLEALRLDEPVVELFELPPEASAAKEVELKKGTLSPSARLRASAFQRVEARLSSGDLVWNDDTRVDWETVLDAVHREIIRERYSEWQEKQRAWIERLAERMRAALGEDPSSENVAKLRQQFDESRKKLEAVLDETEEACLEKLPTTTCEHSTHDSREELFEVERKVVRSVYDELVRKPTLAHFDEQTEATFDS